jgi:hypothetical protein
LRNRNTIEFLGVWEHINNPEFKPLEFEGFRSQAGLNSFVLTAGQWIDTTGAIGLLSQRGRHGGTFAHRDIAFEFASWISVEFKLYLIKEFQRLKTEESRRLSTAWDLNRTLSKLNYRIHTEAVRANLIPPVVTATQAARTYASEADMLNVALFGHTAKQWREASPGLDGNMRDHATIQQLLVLANLESLNAELIQMGLPQGERLQKLNAAAIRQMGGPTAGRRLWKEASGARDQSMTRGDGFCGRLRRSACPTAPSAASGTHAASSAHPASARTARSPASTARARARSPDCGS